MKHLIIKSDCFSFYIRFRRALYIPLTHTARHIARGDKTDALTRFAFRIFKVAYIIVIFVFGHVIANRDLAISQFFLIFSEVPCVFAQCLYKIEQQC